MKVVYLSSEVVPFAKTGGLADIAGTIPKSLQKLGVEIVVFMPLYGMIKESPYPIIKTDIQFEVKIGDKFKTGGVYKGFLPDTKVPIYFLDNEQYFGREGLYNYPGTTADFEDNCERFIFFAQGALEVIEKLKVFPDIVHCNDWQTGLVPVYLKTNYAKKSCFKNTKTIMTIHNLAYQGWFWHWDMKLTGLDWGLFNWRQLEFFGKLNFLKAGIVFSDLITTVSKTYAEEIQTPEYGAGLDGVLRERARGLYGIINGIDYSLWNPETDKHIIVNYGLKSLSGKQLCKRALQRKYKLPERDCPIIAMITRLADQKGLDLVVDKFQDLMKVDLQFVVLGTGDQRYHVLFQDYAESVGARVAAAARALRATREELMQANGWSLRALHQAAEVEGPHPLKDAQRALDEAVAEAYGMPPDQEVTEFLLDLNRCLAEDEEQGRKVTGPGLPPGLDPEDPRWSSDDCIEPPALPE